MRTGVAPHPRGPIAVVECRFDRHGGTMGVAAGERIVRAFGRAREAGLPVAAFVASGGARLQEGMLALTQMARTAGAVGRFRGGCLPFAAVLRPHTTGGVYASWASLADVLAAEPGATIGFGGPRVVEQVTGSLPPRDSHTAEAAYVQGRVDALVGPEAQWAWLGDALYGPGPALRLPSGRPRPTAPRAVPRDAWDAVLHARDPSRPSGLEWSALLTEGWVELRGADPAVRAGLAVMAGERIVVVAMDRHAHGDASARVLPAGYRLAQRAFALAERLRLPVLALIDTPGAEPGPAAEADGLAGEIAQTLLVMSGLTVPTVAVCVGEGGSGGAMAFAHADRLLALEGSVFSVIGPEPGAAVLYRDASRAPELARSFRLTAAELARLGVVDDVLADGDVGAVRSAVVAALREARPGERDARVDRLARGQLRVMPGESRMIRYETKGMVG
ncbi:carboxyl transferase domain-containing protein [Streptomyces sp. NPDC004237]|uniref:carboxyl transferase domain-containing protein n=1 Tax=Streptomyces sp. NPDC004237 TaxID=3154455 RepID=UPI0033AC6A46